MLHLMLITLSRDLPCLYHDLLSCQLHTHTCSSFHPHKKGKMSLKNLKNLWVCSSNLNNLLLIKLFIERMTARERGRTFTCLETQRKSHHIHCQSRNCFFSQQLPEFLAAFWAHISVLMPLDFNFGYTAEVCSLHTKPRGHICVLLP